MNKEIPQTPRAIVVELSVKTEEAVNLVLAKLLGITAAKSKSFGSSNQALSFNAKANLLLDLNHLDKEQREMFQIFMEIRNKFAHISSVDTFEKCFAQTGSYNRLKKIFNIDMDGESLENDMETMFYILSVKISTNLKTISENIYKDMALKYSQRRWTETFIEKKDEYKKIHPENSEPIEDFIIFIRNILLQEVDENIKNKISLKN